jgi:hypothetical protein
VTYPKTTPLPDEDPPKPDFGRLGDDEQGGDSVPDHGLIGEYASNVRHQEHNGAAYRLTRLRPPPQEFPGPTTGQGRLFPSAVHRPEERVGEVPQTFTHTPNGERLQYDEDPIPGPTSDTYALGLRVYPGEHQINFRRPGAPTLTGNGQEAPSSPNRAEAGRTIRSAIYRPEQKY